MSCKPDQKDNYVKYLREKVEGFEEGFDTDYFQYLPFKVGFYGSIKLCYSYSGTE